MPRAKKASTSKSSTSTASKAKPKRATAASKKAMKKKTPTKKTTMAKAKKEQQREKVVKNRKQQHGRVAPYKKTEDLPENVQKHLPEHGKHIYLEAFNHAFEQYQDPKKRRNRKDDPEKIAHAVAWSAVKHKYHKEEGVGDGKSGAKDWKAGGAD